MQMFTKCLSLSLLAGDYTVVRMTLTFPAGTTRMPVTIRTLDDNVGEPSEMFTAVLSSPGSGLVLGPQDTATITIPENDSKKWDRGYS